MNPQATAFPVNSTCNPGISIRQWYATVALKGLLSSSHNYTIDGKSVSTPEEFCRVAFRYADAMLKAEEL